MLGTFILGIAAGWGAPAAEPRIKTLLESILPKDTPVLPLELRLYAFALCLLGAAILSMIFFEPHAGPLALGAVLGAFGPRLRDQWKASRAPDYDS